MGKIFGKGKEMVQNKLIALAFCILFFITPAKSFDLEKYYAEPLTYSDKKGIVIFNILQGIDMLQTLEIANNDNYYETNSILGRHPSKFQVLSYFVARGLAHYEVTKMIPEKYRSFWHAYNIIYNYDVIKDNHEIGIRIGF